MRLALAFVLVIACSAPAHANTFVFETGAARLVLGSDGTTISLAEKLNGTERLRASGLPFAVVSKNGHQFPSSAIEWRGKLLHVTFGASGDAVDYRITSSSDCIVVELAGIQGDGIQELRFVQLSTPLANDGGPFLNIHWDDNFAVSLMGLSDSVDTRTAGPMAWASVYPSYSMLGQRVAIIAVPTSSFLDMVRKVELDFKLPSPTIHGVWAKQSVDAASSYLFTDLTEANADEIIHYAKLGGAHYILIESDSWAASPGSYPINLASFPHGEAGLKSVIDKCHAAGLKVGMHMLTSLIGKNDPLVQPKPNPGLLKDGEAILAMDVSMQAAEITAASTLAGFSTHAGYYGTATDVQIDDEIIHYDHIKGTDFFQCVRGYARTKPAIHKAGAKIEHLAEADGYYFADLRSPLAVSISDRIAGLINRTGFDMIYFDGGELNAVQGASWYWMGVQQNQIWRRTKRDLLMQGSGATNWTWHLFARGTCDDSAYVAVNEYLDYHKIADDWTHYHSNFVLPDLGWVGLLDDAPDYHATTPDEMEHLAVRMLALDSPLGLQSRFSTLKGNGRTEEILVMLGAYEHLRLSGSVPEVVRRQLMHGSWHMTSPGKFQPTYYEEQQVSIPSDIRVSLKKPAQPLKFHLQVEPNLAAIGDPANISLLQGQPPIEIGSPAPEDKMPGALAQRVVFNNPLNLTAHRALAVQLEVERPLQTTGEGPILNIQLESGGFLHRDYYIDLNFQGDKTIILTEPGTKRMLSEFRPDPSNYPFKFAMRAFDYARVNALNVRWMRYTAASGILCKIRSVMALQERSGTLEDLEISTGTAKIMIPGAMRTGDYAEFSKSGPIRVFDRNGFLLRTSPATFAPALKTGPNVLSIKASSPGMVKLTIALGG